jgi:hypothetical protein
VRVNADEPPEVNDEATPEDGQVVPRIEKVRKFLKKHGSQLIVAGGALLVVVVASALRPDEEHGTTTCAEYTEEPKEPEDSGLAADSSEEKAQRNRAVEHDVSPHKRRLANGRVIDVSGYKRGGSSEDEDEAPDEAAA